jgi:hypothetical protein
MGKPSRVPVDEFVLSTREPLRQRQINGRNSRHRHGQKSLFGLAPCLLVAGFRKVCLTFTINVAELENIRR